MLNLLKQLVKKLHKQLSFRTLKKFHLESKTRFVTTVSSFIRINIIKVFLPVVRPLKTTIVSSALLSATTSLPVAPYDDGRRWGGACRPVRWIFKRRKLLFSGKVKHKQAQREKKNLGTKLKFTVTAFRRHLVWPPPFVWVRERQNSQPREVAAAAEVA